MNPTRTVTLEELFDSEQLKVVEKIITQIKQQHADTNTLRIYLKSQSKQLEAKGVDDGYLFYALVYNLQLQ
jgi:hypothetical protein